MRLLYLTGFLAGTAIKALAARPSAVERLRAENTALKADRDRLNAIANQLAGANTDMAATIREMVTLDDIADDDNDDDDLTALADIVAESNVVHPSLIGPLCEEFSREIDARIDAVTEEWSA